MKKFWKKERKVEKNKEQSKISNKFDKINQFQIN